MNDPNDRRDDWHRGVDENLASLNAGQRIWERELKLVHKIVADIDALLRGDPVKDTDGLIARLHQEENELNLIKAVLLKDKAGNKGLVGRVEMLESGERTSDNRWKFATAIVVAIVSVLGVFLNRERISAFISHKSNDTVEQLIQKAKHPKRRHIVIRETPPESEPQE